MSKDAPRILVADDDPDLRANLTEWLEASGFDVRAASNGKEAMRLATDMTCEVVVTDLRMPEVDGLALIEWCKERQPDTAVIFLSGQATVQDAVKALREWGGFDFLEKPIELTVLNKGIERAIARSKVPRSEPPVRGSVPLSDPHRRTFPRSPRPERPQPAARLLGRLPHRRPAA